MHVFAALGELSFSMLVTLLTLAVSALPVQSAASELTPETFGPSIKKGLWFIEHYSPYCVHCKSFKPTWDQLVVESEKETPTVKLSTINCIIHGDLCNQNGIEGWPTLLMFDDGKVVGQFKGSRDLDRLKKFINEYVKEEPQTPTARTPPPPPPSPPPVVNPTGEVLSLDGDLFTTTLSKGPAFIKFYAPWCGHCKKLAPIWKQLARHMKYKLTVAEVNCDDNAALCKSQSIEGYPTLIFFDSNGVKSEYNGGRKLIQLKAFSERASARGVLTLDGPDDLENIVAKEDVMFLLLHSPEDSEIQKFVTEAAAPLLGSPAIYASSSPELHSQYPIQSGSHWSITVHKDHDTHLPTSTFYGSHGVTKAKLRTWLLRHRLPTTLELTQDTFRSVMYSPQAPLVVIAASQAGKHDKIRDQFIELAKKWRWRTEGSGMVNGREVVFTWMDTNEWGKWMKSMYGIKPNDDDHSHDHGHDHVDLEDVKVIISDHSKLIYYETDRLGSPIKMSSSSKLFPALDDAALGKSPYKHSESYVERGAKVLSDKLKAADSFISDRPYHFVFILAVGLAIISLVIYKLVGNDAASAMNFHAHKGRLD